MFLAEAGSILEPVKFFLVIAAYTVFIRDVILLPLLGQYIQDLGKD
jgi:hypothetical protein